MSVEIDCPSGLRLRIRGLKGKESRLLADKNAIRQGTSMESILAACTEEVLDPAHYVVKKDGTLDWSQVLLGDRFFVFIQIRLITFGPEYRFTMQCKDTMCRQKFDVTIDLEKDLVVSYLSDDDREVLQGDGLFKTSLADGSEVRYRLATGADERASAKRGNRDDAMIEMLASRITSIEGLETPEQVGPVHGATVGVKGLKSFLEDLDWSELVNIFNALDEHDCGVKTEIEVECTTCGGVQEVHLPLGRNFFLPRETKAISNSL